LAHMVVAMKFPIYRIWFQVDNANAQHERHLQAVC